MSVVLPTDDNHRIVLQLSQVGAITLSLSSNTRLVNLSIISDAKLELTLSNDSGETRIGIGIDTEAAMPRPEVGAFGNDHDKVEWLKKMRGWIMVVAVLIVSVTYSAGTNPPGGLWQDDLSGSHKAGDPIMGDRYPVAFFVFRLSNSVALAQSLAIIMLLMRHSVFTCVYVLRALHMLVVGAVLALAVAYSFSYIPQKMIDVDVFYLVVGFLIFVEALAWMRVVVRRAVGEIVAEWWRKRGKVVVVVLRVVIIAAIVAMTVASRNFAMTSDSAPYALSIGLYVVLVLGALIWSNT